MSQLILYDLPSRGKCATWSLNPWKTRLSLNYKGVNYKTEWVDYPDIKAKWQSLNIPPGEGGLMPYTIPMVRLPEGGYLQDSWAIAQELEKLYSTPDYPSLHLDYEKLNEVIELVGEFTKTTVACWMPKVPRSVLDERNAEYFYRTRKEIFGMPLDELEKQKGGDDTWNQGRPHAEKLGAILDATDGPFFMGRTASYADFVVVGLIHFLGKAEPTYINKFYEFSPQFKPLYEASRQWLERDDH